MQQSRAPPSTDALFDDTSTTSHEHAQQQGYQGFNPTQFANDPMANMAFQYGTSLASQGKDYVDKNVRILKKNRVLQICEVETLTLTSTLTLKLTLTLN